MTLLGKPKRMETGVVSCSIGSSFELTNSQFAKSALRTLGTSSITLREVNSPVWPYLSESIW